MYTSAKFVPCNGQHIIYQSNEYRVYKDSVQDHLKHMASKSELTLSFHNLIKRGSVFFNFNCASVKCIDQAVNTAVLNLK